MSSLRESEEHLRTSLLTGVSAVVTRMCMVWHSLGLDAKSVLERTSGVVRHVEGFLKGLVNEEEELKTKIEKRIEQLAQKIAALCDELSLAPYEVCVNVRISVSSRRCAITCDIVSETA